MKCVDDMKTDELKKELKKRGAPVSGKVAQLRQRLQKILDEEEEESEFSSVRR
jgi:hypothetical protein